MYKASHLLITAFLTAFGLWLMSVAGEIFAFDTNRKTFVLELNDAPQLIGPDRLCNVFGSVIGTFSGGGDPANDVYSWKILGPSSQELWAGSGGAGFQTISYTFSLVGSHQVSVRVTRGGIEIGNFSKAVAVIKGPSIVLQPNYSTCNSASVTMTAISPADPNLSNYEFVWKDSAGNEVGNQNDLTTSSPGNYSVEFYFVNSSGEPECITLLATELSESESTEIVQDKPSVCPDEVLTFSTSPSKVGDWYIKELSTSTETFFATANMISVKPLDDLKAPGSYEVIFKAEDPSNPVCDIYKTAGFEYFDKPNLKLLTPIASSGCNSPNGTVRIEALTSMDLLTMKDQATSFTNLTKGDILEFPALKSGSYTLVAQLGGCTNTFTSIVPLDNPPAQLEFSIQDIEPETCSPSGIKDGSFKVILTNGPFIGNYRLVNERGALILDQPIGTSSEILVSIEGGTYYFEVYDENDCSLPKLEEILVPGLSLVSFTIPGDLSVCKTYDLIPQTNQPLEFTLTYPDGSQETKNQGESFSLTQAGNHRLLGLLPNQSEFCPDFREFTVSLVSPVDFAPKIVNQDCFGNMTYEADIFGRDPSTVIFNWIDENDQIAGTGQFLNPVSYGNYKLDVQPANSATCPIPPFEFVINEPVLAVDVTLESTKLCEYGPRAVVDLSTTFPEEITHIEWRRYDDLGVIETLPQFNNKWQITADIAGIYEVAVFSRIPAINKNCELGRQTLDIDLTPNKVAFQAPSELFICDPYSLVPVSASPLEFALTFPDGKIEIKNWNEPFTLNQAGSYTLLGYDPNIKGPLCPDEKNIVVTLFEPVEFSPELVNLSCTGEYHYTALVSNYLPGEVDYFWKDSQGNLLSITPDFFSTLYGDFTLEVQPAGSIPCTILPISFSLSVPILAVSPNIAAETLCPDQPDAALRLETDFTLVEGIEWWYTDLSNNQSILASETGKKEILAKEEGTYEVRVFNAFDCLLGTDEVFVARSTDQGRPVLEENYQVCPKYQIAPTLNPGSFAQYEWYFEDNLVSTSSTFKPLQIGTYYLIVFSNEGCAYETGFETQEECDLKVAFPNALQPNNPDKQFLAYANFLVDELEIWVFNKWGNLIFHCFHTNVAPGESACLWDGTYDGKPIPPGSYAVRINSRNIEKNLRNEQWESILVID